MCPDTMVPMRLRLAPALVLAVVALGGCSSDTTRDVEQTGPSAGSATTPASSPVQRYDEAFCTDLALWLEKVVEMDDGLKYLTAALEGPGNDPVVEAELDRLTVSLPILADEAHVYAMAVVEGIADPIVRLAIIESDKHWDTVGDLAGVIRDVVKDPARDEELTAFLADWDGEAGEFDINEALGVILDYANPICLPDG